MKVITAAIVSFYDMSISLSFQDVCSKTNKIHEDQGLSVKLITSHVFR